jgi:hypothetical protein
MAVILLLVGQHHCGLHCSCVQQHGSFLTCSELCDKLEHLLAVLLLSLTEIMIFMPPDIFTLFIIVVE